MSHSDEVFFVARCATPQDAMASVRSIEQAAGAVSDWDEVVRLAVQNRVGPLVYTNLRAAGLSGLVPRAPMRSLETSYFQSLAYCTSDRPTVSDVLAGMQRAAIAAIVLRGLALGERVYGDPALRPFSDMDLLVRKDDVPRAKEILFDLGYDLPFGSVDARYFERNHLHVQLVKGDRAVELHWALDHKYTTFAIDYAEIFRDATSGRVAGVETACLSSEDLLLALCVHLVKHCPCSRYVAPGRELLDQVLSAGFLILYCDVVALLRRPGPLDWTAVVDKARRWQVESAVQPVLTAAAQLFEAPVPPAVLTGLPAPRIGGFERTIRSWAAPYSPDGPRAKARPSFLAKWLNDCSDLVFRPVRALDLFQYLWPSAAFVSRRYGAENRAQIGLYRCVHLGRALGELWVNLGDVVYYAGLKPRLSGIRSKRTVAPPRRPPR